MAPDLSPLGSRPQARPAANPNAAMPAPYAPAVSPAGVPRPPMLWIPANTIQQRSGAPIDTIVLHHTNSTGAAQADASFFANPETKVSAHYIVGKDGTIIQCVPDASMARHAGVSEFQGREDVNDFSLGIEIVNGGDGVDPYTDAQYRALGQLMAYLQTLHGVPWQRVTGHKDIARPVGRKDDPSPNFSYQRLMAEVARITNAVPGSAPPQRPVDTFQRNPLIPTQPFPAPMPAMPRMPAPFDPRYQ